MTAQPQPIDRTKCPLCGNSNTCGREAGLDCCWCAELTFPRNPPHTVMSCFCRSCTEKLLAQERSAADIAS